MNYPHRLSQLLSNSESRPSESRLSRYDRHSKIPRSMNQRGSLDRISGVHVIDNIPSSASRSISKPMRNRSADSVRQTLSVYRSKADSVQRIGQKRSRSISTALSRETPQNKTFATNNYLTTPMSSMSNQGRISHQRTPSNERPRSGIEMLERNITQFIPKDARPHTDSTWSREKCNEIIDKLRSHSCTSALIPPGAVPLKPISMNLFINITNALLSELCGPSNAVNAKNYTEKIPEIAAKLMYPGVMTKSWLISVYASHTYPHMMAFFGYLLELIETNDRIKENMSIETLYSSNENENILIQRYLYYQESWIQYQDEDFQDFESIADKYIENYKEICGFSDERKEFLENKLNETRRKNEHAIGELEKVQQIEKQVHEELSILCSRAEQLRELEKDLRNQINTTINNCTDLDNSLQCSTNSIKELENKLEQLELQLKNQTMSIKDRDDILKEIDYLKECYNSKVECFSDMENVSFEKDIELAKAQKEALKGSAIVNKSLVRVGLAAGKDLTGYGLNERDLLLKDTSEMKNKTILAFEQLKEEAERRLQTACFQKDSEISQKLELQNKIEMEMEIRDALKIDLIDKQKENDKLKMNLNQIKEQLSAKCRNRNELKQKNQNALGKYKDVEKQLNHWKEQECKWKERICELRKRKESAKSVYEKQAEEIILEYIGMVKGTIPDVSKLQK